MVSAMRFVGLTMLCLCVRPNKEADYHQYAQEHLPLAY